MKEDNKRGLLKRTLAKKLAYLEEEIEKIEKSIREDKNCDYKVCFTKLGCLQHNLSDINDLINICIDRNKF